LNRRDAAAFARIGAWALRRFVFVNARKFDLEALLASAQILNSPPFVFQVPLT